MIYHRDRSQANDTGVPAGKASAVNWKAAHDAPYGALVLAVANLDTASQQWAIPAAMTPYRGDLRAAVRFSFNTASFIRLVANVRTAGPAGTVLRVMARFYRAGSGVIDESVGATNTPSIAADSTGLKDSGFVAVQSDLVNYTGDPTPGPLLPMIYVAGAGGDGATLVNFGSIYVYVR